MKNFTLKTLFMSALLCVGLSARAEDELYYTLDPVAGKDNGYGSSEDIAINGITWNVMGNSTLVPWRIGGKSLSGVNRAVYSKTAMGKAITKVELKVGAASSITVNSLTLIVASDAAFSSVIDEVSATFAANSTITFTPKSSLTEWAENAYYKFVFNVSVSGTSNKFVEFSEAKFYKAGSGLPSAELSYGEESSVTVTRGGSFTLPTLSNPHNVSVTYSSTNTDVATIDNNGAVTIKGKGETEISASFAGNDTYASGSASYTLKVNYNDATVSFTDENPSVNIGNTYTNSLTKDPTGLSVTYESSKTDIATVDAAGEVTGVAEGKTTIKANWAEQEVNGVYYNSGSISYSLTVNDPSKVVYDFSGTDDYGSSIEKTTDGSHYDYDESTWTNGDINIKVVGKYRWWKNDGTLRFYSNTPTSNFTVSAAEGYYVSKVVLTGGSNFKVNNGTYDYGSSTWTGAAPSVKFTHNTSSTVSVKTITVYIKPNYTRATAAGNFGTICLPYGVNEGGFSGATFYTISSKTVEGSVVTGINLEPVTSLTAGVGYIFQSTATTISLTPNGTTVATPVTTGSIIGTFTDETAVPNDMYIVSGNKLCPTANDYGYINAYRAYINLTNVPVSGSAAKVRISVQGDDATAISAIEATEAVNNDVIYNLSGQRVVKPLKGIYIQNGKKFIVK